MAPESNCATLSVVYLTIIPRARMGYESIAHKAEWAIDSEAMRARGIIVLCKIQLVGQKNIKTKHLSQVKARLQSSFTAKTLQIWRRFLLLVGCNI